jgi:hypothetical protein
VREARVWGWVTGLGPICYYIMQVSTIASKGAIDQDALGHSNLIAKLLDKLSILTN